MGVANANYLQAPVIRPYDFESCGPAFGGHNKLVPMRVCRGIRRSGRTLQRQSIVVSIVSY